MGLKCDFMLTFHVDSVTISLEGKQAVLYLQESTASCKIFVVLARVLSLGVFCEISTS